MKKVDNGNKNKKPLYDNVNREDNGEAGELNKGKNNEKRRLAEWEGTFKERPQRTHFDVYISRGDKVTLRDHRSRSSFTDDATHAILTVPRWKKH